MSKIVAVFGATGQQGGSIVNYVLNDPLLSQQYKIRAISSNIHAEKAQQLNEKVEVVHGDMLDRASLSSALTGVHTVFAMTAPSLDPSAEYSIAKMVADVAVEQGVEYMIFSTLPSVHELSGGKYTKVAPFDAKAKAERYIRGLPIKSAFCSLGSFMENFQSETFLAPRKADDGTWVVALPVSPQTQWPLVYAVADTGKFVGAVLAEPEKYSGKTFCAAARFYSLEEMIAIMSEATGKTIVYKQISLGEFRKGLAVPEPVAELFMDMLAFLEETGYFGPDGEELVAWAVENARGRLSTFEEYLETHPLRLE